MNILFVCHGNINRSKAAEIIFSQLLPDNTYSSAGVKEEMGNNSITGKMKQALTQEGFTIPDNLVKSRKLTEDMLKEADIVYYMDSGNIKRLVNNYPAEYTEKYESLASIIERKSIPDPHFHAGTTKHVEVVQMLKECAETLGGKN